MNLPDSPTGRLSSRQTAGMGATFTVHGSSRAECMTALAEVCVSLGLRPSLLPRQVTDGRWLARAVPAVDDQAVGGSAHRGERSRPA